MATALKNQEIIKLVDDDIVYRRITKKDYSYPSGQLKIHSTAFNDGYQKPSVVIHKLCGEDPQGALRNHDAYGIVKLTTKDVREVKVEIQTKPVSKHDVDIKHSPLKEDYAHGHIEAAPKFSNDSQFKKLKERLAKIAEKSGIIIEPTI